MKHLVVRSRPVLYDGSFKLQFHSSAAQSCCYGFSLLALKLFRWKQKWDKYRTYAQCQKNLFYIECDPYSVVKIGMGNMNGSRKYIWSASETIIAFLFWKLLFPKKPTFTHIHPVFSAGTCVYACIYMSMQCAPLKEACKIALNWISVRWIGKSTIYDISNACELETFWFIRFLGAFILSTCCKPLNRVSVSHQTIELMFVSLNTNLHCEWSGTILTVYSFESLLIASK